MSDKEESGAIKVNPKTIITWLGVVIPVWGMMTTGILFYQDIMFKSQTDLTIYMKKSDNELKETDAKIERTEILIAFYEDKADSLSESQKNKYELAKARLARLQAKRDEETGVVRD